MKKLLASAVCISFLVAGQAFAQAKKGKIPEGTVKVHADNARALVTETTFQPGAGTNQATQPPYRITKAIKGGTLERTFTDGTRDSTTWKDGEVREEGGGRLPFTLKNTGKADVILYTVQPKAAAAKK